MVRVRIKNRLGLEWHLGLRCASHYQYSGEVWVKIFLSTSPWFYVTNKPQ